jgi:hypothetical protein
MQQPENATIEKMTTIAVYMIFSEADWAIFVMHAACAVLGTACLAQLLQLLAPFSS